MSDPEHGPFDPYRIWLGIPPQHQPPTHYRLLGIEAFEADADVIAHAADQRMAHVKTFAAGKHAEASHRLLNEIAAARICLLNAADKARYDEALRMRQVPAAAPAARAAVARAAAPPVRGQRAQPAEDGSNRVVWYFAGGAVVATALVIALIWGLTQRDGQPTTVAQTSGGDAGSTSDVGGVAPPSDPPATSAGTPSTGPESQSTKPDEPPPTPQAKPPHPPESTVTAPDNTSAVTPPPTQPPQPPDAMPAEPPEQPETPPAKPIEPPDKHDTPAKKPEKSPAEPPETNPEPLMPPETAPPETPAEAKRIVPPREEAAKRAEREIRDLYKDKLQKATTLESKLSLSREMLGVAAETKDSPANQFMLTRVAAQLAAEAEDLDEAMNIYDRLGKQFEIDPFELKVALLPKSESPTAKPPSPAMNQKILAASRRLADDALAAGEVDVAAQSLKAALAAARRAKDLKLRVTIESMLKKVDQLKAQRALAMQAEEQLATEPDNAKANVAAGTWDCFVCGNWTKGLPRLAKGDDQTLAALAKQDLAGPTDGTGLLDVAESWWKLAEQHKGIEAQRIQARATVFFKRAVPRVKGLEAKRLENRLEELGLHLVPYALKFDGKSNCVLIKNFTYDGSYPITLEAIVCPPLTAGEDSSGYDRAILSNRLAGVGGLTLAGGVGYQRGSAVCRFIMSERTSGGGTQINEIGGRRIARSTTGAPAWFHVAAVADGRELRLYVHGKLDDQRPCGNVHSPSDLPFLIGASYAGRNGRAPPQLGSFFTGLIRAVRISATARYTKDFSPPAEFATDVFTRVLFDFHEGKGAQLHEPAGGNLAGEINGAEWIKLEADGGVPAGVNLTGP